MSARYRISTANAELKGTNEGLWILDDKDRLVVFCDVTTGRADESYPYPEDCEKEFPFSGILPVDCGFYLAPRFADAIYYYSYDKSEYCNLKLNAGKYREIEERNGRKDFTLTLYNGKLLCVSRSPDILFEISMDLDGYDTYDLSKHRKYNGNFSTANCQMDIKGNELIIPFVRDFFLSYDLEKKSYRPLLFNELCDGKFVLNDDVEEKVLGYKCYDEAELFYTTYGKIIIKQENHNKCIDVVKYIPDYFRKNKIAISINNVFLVEGCLWVAFPFQKDLMRIDITTEEVMIFENNILITDGVNDDVRMFGSVKMSGNIIAMCGGPRGDFSFDTGTHEYNKINFWTDGNDIISYICSKNIIIQEADFLESGIKAFVEAI